MNMAEIEKPVRITEAAEFLGRSRWSVYRLVATHKIPFHPQGKILYFFRSELEKWIRSGRMATNVELEGKAAVNTLRRSR